MIALTFCLAVALAALYVLPRPNRRTRAREARRHAAREKALGRILKFTRKDAA